MAKGSGAYDKAYSDAMERIQGQLEEQKELAIQVLSWITCAKRPLSTSELQHALAVEIGESELDAEHLPDLEDMVSVCAGLVTVDGQSDVIRLVHYTIQEYFERTQQQWFSDGHATITEICVAYLSFDVFESGICQNKVDFEQQLESYKLYGYASHNWGHHARESSILCPGVLGFLQTQGPVESSSQALMAFGRERGDCINDMPEHFAGLHLAAFFGLQDAVQVLASSDNLEVRDSWDRTPLFYAALNGHTDAMRLLLDKTADVNVADKGKDTPLHLASIRGHVEVVRLLLDEVADVNVADIYKDTPLHFGSWAGHIEVVRLLLDKGADVHIADYRKFTPLLSASRGGHIKVVRLLLDKGADVNAANWYKDTPLHSACKGGHIEAVQLLLDNGADVNAAGDGKYRPLHEASYGGYVEVVRLLLEWDADIHATNDDGKTPSNIAAERGHVEIVKLLQEAAIKASRQEQ